MDFYTARDKGEQQVYHQTSTTKILQLLKDSQYGDLELDSMVNLRNKYLGEHRAAQESPGHGSNPLQGVNRGILDFSDKPRVTSISEAVLNEDLEALKAAIQSFGNPPIESEQLLEPDREAWIRNWRKQHLDGFFNENKVNALVLASEKGMTEYVRLLLEAQASVNYETKASATPLVYAINRQSVNVVSLLLENKADPCHNVEDHISPAAPIHLACKSGCLKIVKMLINHNANLSQLDGIQNTPLITSIHFSRPQVANYLLTHALKAEMSENNNVEVHDNLLKKDHQSMHGTALTQALEKKFFSTAELLFKYGADPNLSKRDGVNPLLISTWMGHRGMVKLCIDAKADLDYVIMQSASSSSQNLVGMNALKFAANKRHFLILKQLLESEASPNSSGPSRDTAMHLLAKEIYEASSKSIASPKKMVEDQAKMLKILAEFGGDPYLENCKGNTVEGLTFAYPDVQADIVKAMGWHKKNREEKNKKNKRLKEEEEKKKLLNAKRLAKKKKKKTKRRGNEEVDIESQLPTQAAKSVQDGRVTFQNNSPLVNDPGGDGFKRKKKRKKRKKVLSDAERAMKELLHEEEINLKRQGERQQRAKKKRQEARQRAQIKEAVVEKVSSSEVEQSASEEAEEPIRTLPPTTTVISPDLMDGFQAVVKKRRRRNSQKDPKNEELSGSSGNQHTNSHQSGQKSSDGQKSSRRSFNPKAPSPKTRGSSSRPSPRGKQEFSSLHMLIPNNRSSSKNKSLSKSGAPSSLISLKPPLSHNVWGNRKGIANLTIIQNVQKQQSQNKSSPQARSGAKQSTMTHKTSRPSVAPQTSEPQVINSTHESSEAPVSRGRPPEVQPKPPPHMQTAVHLNTTPFKTSPPQPAPPGFPSKVSSQAGEMEAENSICGEHNTVPNPHEFEPASPSTLSLSLPLPPAALSDNMQKPQMLPMPITTNHGQSGNMAHEVTHRKGSVDASLPMQECLAPTQRAYPTQQSVHPSNSLPQIQMASNIPMQQQSRQNRPEPKNRVVRNNSGQQIWQERFHNRIQQPQTNNPSNFQNRQRNQPLRNQLSDRSMPHPRSDQRLPQQRQWHMTFESKVDTTVAAQALQTQMPANQIKTVRQGHSDPQDGEFKQKAQDMRRGAHTLAAPNVPPVQTYFRNNSENQTLNHQHSVQNLDNKTRNKNQQELKPAQNPHAVPDQQLRNPNKQSRNQNQMALNAAAQQRISAQNRLQNSQLAAHQATQQKNNQFIQANFSPQPNQARFNPFQINSQQWVEQQQLLYLQMWQQHQKWAAEFYQPQGHDISRINVNQYRPAQAPYYQQVNYPYRVIPAQHYQMQQAQPTAGGQQRYDHFQYAVTPVPYYTPNGAYTAQVQAPTTAPNQHRLEKPDDSKDQRYTNDPRVKESPHGSQPPETTQTPMQATPTRLTKTTTNAINKQPGAPVMLTPVHTTSRGQIPAEVQKPNTPQSTSNSNQSSQQLASTPISSAKNANSTMASTNTIQSSSGRSPQNGTNIPFANTGQITGQVTTSNLRKPSPARAGPPGLQLKSNPQQNTIKSHPAPQTTIDPRQAQPNFTQQRQQIPSRTTPTKPPHQPAPTNTPRNHATTVQISQPAQNRPVPSTWQNREDNKIQPTQDSKPVLSATTPSSNETHSTPSKQVLTSNNKPFQVRKQQTSTPPNSQTKPTAPRSSSQDDGKSPLVPQVSAAQANKPWGRKKAWASLAAGTKSSSMDKNHYTKPFRLNVVGQNSRSNNAAGLIHRVGTHFRIALHIPAEFNSKVFAHSILANGGELHKEIMRKIGVRISIHPKQNIGSKSAFSSKHPNLPVDVEISSEKMESVRSGALRLLEIVNQNLPDDKEHVTLRDIARRPTQSQSRTQPRITSIRSTTHNAKQSIQKGLIRKVVVVPTKPKEDVEPPAFLSKPRVSRDPSLCPHCGMHKVRSGEICVFDDTLI